MSTMQYAQHIIMTNNLKCFNDLGQCCPTFLIPWATKLFFFKPRVAPENTETTLNCNENYELWKQLLCNNIIAYNLCMHARCVGRLKKVGGQELKAKPKPRAKPEIKRGRGLRRRLGESLPRNFLKIHT